MKKDTEDNWAYERQKKGSFKNKLVGLKMLLSGTFLSFVKPSVQSSAWKIKNNEWGTWISKVAMTFLTIITDMLLKAVKYFILM
jgi:hypothetical protein